MYVLGALTDWQLKEEFKLEYNAAKKQYEKAVLLKQGYYNYHYALNDTATKTVDVSYIRVRIIKQETTTLFMFIIELLVKGTIVWLVFENFF